MLTSKLINSGVIPVPANTICVHFLSEPPTVELVEAYRKNDIKKVMWVQPHAHLAREFYESTAQNALVSQHICLPNWALDSLDDIAFSQRTYVEAEKISTLMMLDMHETSHVAGVLMGAQKLIRYFENIRSIVLDPKCISDDTSKFLQNHGFSLSVHSETFAIYSK